MDLSNYPPETRKLIEELLKHNTISREGLSDLTMLNYISTQVYDEDFVDSMRKDR